METLENSLRWISAPIALSYSLDSANAEAHRFEFDSLSETDEDPLGQWLRLAKARGETKESDPVMLAILVDLHRKMDELKELITGEKRQRLELVQKARIEGLNFTHFLLSDSLLVPGERYYARVQMPVFPLREIPLFFVAREPRVAELEVLHERDQKAWDSYTASRERTMIRQMKGKSHE